MAVREGACAVCSADLLDALRAPRVEVVAEANWVEIRCCGVCGAYWDVQPASRPVVVTLDEALRRAPDLEQWSSGRDPGAPPVQSV
ncbi:hypothetical protein GCM10023160_33960 [Brachybacterium paraconglomeratum]